MDQSGAARSSPSRGARSSLSSSTQPASPSSSNRDRTAEVRRRKEQAERLVRERKERMIAEQDEKAKANKLRFEEQRREVLKKQQMDRLRREKEALDRKQASLDAQEAKKKAILARNHEQTSRVAAAKAKPSFAFGSSTPRNLSYLSNLPKEQQKYDQRIRATEGPEPPAAAAVSSPVRSPQPGPSSSSRVGGLGSWAMTASLYVPRTPSSSSKLRQGVMMMRASPAPASPATPSTAAVNRVKRDVTKMTQSADHRRSSGATNSMTQSMYVASPRTNRTTTTAAAVVTPARRAPAAARDAAAARAPTARRLDMPPRAAPAARKPRSGGVAAAGVATAATAAAVATAAAASAAAVPVPSIEVQSHDESSTVAAAVVNELDASAETEREVQVATVPVEAVQEMEEPAPLTENMASEMTESTEAHVAPEPVAAQESAPVPSVASLVHESEPLVSVAALSLESEPVSVIIDTAVEVAEPKVEPVAELPPAPVEEDIVPTDAVVQDTLRTEDEVVLADSEVEQLQHQQVEAVADEAAPATAPVFEKEEEETLIDVAEVVEVEVEREHAVHEPIPHHAAPVTDVMTTSCLADELAELGLGGDAPPLPTPPHSVLEEKEEEQQKVEEEVIAEPVAPVAAARTTMPVSRYEEPVMELDYPEEPASSGTSSSASRPDEEASEEEEVRPPEDPNTPRETVKAVEPSLKSEEEHAAPVIEMSAQERERAERKAKLDAILAKCRAASNATTAVAPAASAVADAGVTVVRRSPSPESVSMSASALSSLERIAKSNGGKMSDAMRRLLETQQLKLQQQQQQGQLPGAVPDN